MVEVSRVFHYRVDVPRAEGLLSILVRGGTERALTIEVGLYRARGTGFFEVQFLQPFSHAPAVVKEALGYVDIGVAKIPLPVFVTGVSSDRVSLLQLAGETLFFFVAVGK